MKPVRRFPFVFAGAAACAALAQTPPAPPAPPDEEDVPAVEEEWDFTKGRGHDLAMLDRLVPEGHSHHGLRYPVYSEPREGKPPVLQSQFESKTVTREDATHLHFRGAVVSLFGDARYPDIATRMISLVEAWYDLQHDILFSNSPVQILDKDVTVRSGSVLHDPVSGLTVFGDEADLYFNEPPSAKQTAPTPPPSPSPQPAPSPQPPPSGP